MIIRKAWIYFPAILFLAGLAHADVWKQIHPGGTIPTARSGHTMVEINNKIYLYGGESADSSALVTGNSMLLNDISIFDLNSLVWTPEEPANNPPPPRKNHSAVALGEKMYILFGEGAQGGLLQDIWVYDPLSKEWQEQVVNSVSKPAARTGHSTVVMYGQIFTYGGKTATGVANDLWSFDLRSKTWVQRENGGIPVYGHKAIADTGTKMYVHGGSDADETMLDDLLSYDLNTQKWENIAVQGEIPSPRAFHVSTFENNKIKISGGRGYDTSGSLTDLGDTWEFDTVAVKWTPKAKVSPHSFSSAVVIPKPSLQAEGEESKIFMFVGQRNGEFLNESWLYYPNKSACMAESITASPKRLTLRKGSNGNVAIMVKGRGDCLVEGVMVTAKIKGKGKQLVGVSPDSQETDANGQAVFTINAKDKKGTAVLKFKASGLNKVATVQAKVR
ncbi:MAG: hypothetical protein HZB37_07740 [Planctomycetes bacterium]|nr:hypothetical protein [Planctomycetota bacterium]